ncbi:E3 SUMO-protein ligase ZBED1-like [Saccostrea echinata]|uniref:E3 SUMO-protein ligase ZBED1-like n=1 Tax=Saccostrea echinata TaxID=191078 RepID=UPI002A81029E|nr:E3 SUMO-protein ligase ZBED1-like [Saccostrea echinata]
MEMHGLACIPVKHDRNNNTDTIPSKILTKPASSQQTLPNVMAVKYPPKSSKAMAITDSIANFIIKDLRPYRIVDSPEFRAMVKTLDSRYQCPSRKQFYDVLIPQKYEAVKTQVQDRLKNAGQIAITTDGWTSRSTESYVTITSTHITDEWKLQNFVLQTRCLPKSHTGENLAEAITKALDEWNIPRTPLFVVSDNAANVTKTGDLLKCELHLGCYAHTLNLAVQKCLGVQWNSAYEMLDRYLSMQAAVVSVLVSKDLKNKDKDLKFLSDDETTLAEDVVTCLKPLKAITTTMCSETSPTASIILPIHYQLLDYVLLPKEGDSPTIVNMKKSMSLNLKERYATKENMLNKVTALDPRFKTLPYLPEEDRLSVFDTLVREAGNLSNTNTQITVKTEPVDNADNPPIPPLPVLPTVSDDSVPHPPEENPIPPKIMKIESKSKPSSSTLNDILGDVYISKVCPPLKKPKLQAAEDEISQYKSCPGIPLNANKLNWWKENQGQFPLLAVLAKKYLCIPGTSVPSERVFSTAGDIVSAQRANLKSKHVDMLIF